jgi:hypothetical protein
MTPCEELYKLLSENVLPEVENVLGQMQTFANENTLTPEMQAEQQNLHAIHDNFLDIHTAIESGEIDPKNCEELLKELNMMRQMGAEMPL